MTDVTNASRTGMMDLATCQWAKDMLPLFRMPEECLPKIVSNAEVSRLSLARKHCTWRHGESSCLMSPIGSMITRLASLSWSPLEQSCSLT